MENNIWVPDVIVRHADCLYSSKFSWIPGQMNVMPYLYHLTIDAKYPVFGVLIDEIFKDKVFGNVNWDYAVRCIHDKKYFENHILNNIRYILRNVS